MTSLGEKVYVGTLHASRIVFADGTVLESATGDVTVERTTFAVRQITEGGDATYTLHRAGVLLGSASISGNGTVQLNDQLGPNTAGYTLTIANGDYDALNVTAIGATVSSVTGGVITISSITHDALITVEHLSDIDEIVEPPPPSPPPTTSLQITQVCPVTPGKSVTYVLKDSVGNAIATDTLYGNHTRLVAQNLVIGAEFELTYPVVANDIVTITLETSATTTRLIDAPGSFKFTTTDVAPILRIRHDEPLESVSLIVAGPTITTSKDDDTPAAIDFNTFSSVLGGGDTAAQLHRTDSIQVRVIPVNVHSGQTLDISSVSINPGSLLSLVEANSQNAIALVAGNMALVSGFDNKNVVINLVFAGVLHSESGGLRIQQSSVAADVVVQYTLTAPNAATTQTLNLQGPTDGVFDVVAGQPGYELGVTFTNSTMNSDMPPFIQDGHTLVAGFGQEWLEVGNTAGTIFLATLPTYTALLNLDYVDNLQIVDSDAKIGIIQSQAPRATVYKLYNTDNIGNASTKIANLEVPQLTSDPFYTELENFSFNVTSTYKIIVQDATHMVGHVIPFGCSATTEYNQANNNLIMITSVTVQNPRLGVVWTPK